MIDRRILMAAFESALEADEQAASIEEGQHWGWEKEHQLRLNRRMQAVEVILTYFPGFLKDTEALQKKWSAS